MKWPTPIGVKRCAVISLGLAAALTFGACGGGKQQAGRVILRTPQEFAAAAQRTASRHTARTVVKSTFYESSNEAVGVIDFEAGTEQFEYWPTGGAEKGEVRRLADATFVREPGAGKWHRWAPDAEVDLGGGLIVGGWDPDGADPADGLAAFRDLRDAAVVGREDRRGVPTTRYRGKLATHDSDDSDGEAEEAEEVDVEAWIDDDGYVRAFETSTHFAGAAFTLSLDLFDFGVPVDVQPPPAGDVVVADPGAPTTTSTPEWTEDWARETQNVALLFVYGEELHQATEVTDPSIGVDAFDPMVGAIRTAVDGLHGSRYAASAAEVLRASEALRDAIRSNGSVTDARAQLRAALDAFSAEAKDVIDLINQDTE